MNLARFAIEKKTFTLVVTVVLILAGILSYQKLGRLEDPAFSIKTAVVYAAYPGASPVEVEKEVTEVLESAIQQMGQLDKVRSISKAGVSIIYVDIKDTYDKHTLPQVWDELRRKMNDVRPYLPPGVQGPMVNDDFGDVYGVFYAVTGDGFSYQEIKSYVDELRKELLLAQDVAKVEIYANQPEAVYVEMSRAKIAQLGISPETIFGTLNKQNTVASAGKVRVGDEYVRVEATGIYDSVDDIGELLVPAKSGALIRLKDIAEIKRDYREPATNLLRFNGKPAIGLGISTVAGGNVVVMGEAVKEVIARMQKTAPLGMEINVISLQSDSVDKAVNGFVINLFEAVIIVIGVLMIFMGAKVGILIGGVLLLTILATFIIMRIYAIDLQSISLGALVVALGMLVDNAIVVAEGIMIKIKQGVERKKAAEDTVNETKWPLLGATFIAILAFAAIGMSNDSTGEYLGSLAQVIAISLTLSWVTAVTLTPLFCVMLLPDPKDDEDDPYNKPMFRMYAKFLKQALRFRWLTVLLMTVLLVFSLYGFGKVSQSFFPETTRAEFMIHYWLPEGTHIDRTAHDMEKIEQYVLSQDYTRKVTTFIGQGALRYILTYQPEPTNTSYGMLLVAVDDYKEIPSILPKLEAYIAANYPDAQAKVQKFVYGPGGGSKIEVRFSGPDADVLRTLSAQAQAIMKADPKAKMIHDDWRQRTKVMSVDVAEARARRLGIDRKAVSDALQMNYVGTTVGLFRDGDNLLPIVARLPEQERTGAETYQEIQLLSPAAMRMVPIKQVTSSVNTNWEDAIIERRDRKRTITVKCDPNEGTANALFKRLRPQFEQIQLPDGYSMEYGGEYENSTRAQKKLFANIPLAFMLMVMTTIALFNRLKQPLIIFSLLPLSVIGVATGLLSTGMPFGFMPLLGLLSLSGMLIKNAIVLLDQIDIDLKAGKTPYNAVVDSGVSRMRPVMMAALTTVLGMLPLVTDAFFASMSVTIMFGLTFATVLTLIVVPVLYAILHKVEQGQPCTPQGSHCKTRSVVAQ